jgi:hypothetical protein
VIVIGIDAHMRSHTAAAVDAATGRQLDTVSVAADEDGQRRLRAFAERFEGEREWAIEDCRNFSRRLERALLGAGERVIRVPPKLMAGQRKSARTYGKSDAIDALAIARAALREPDLPVARLDGPEREIALLLNHPPTSSSSARGCRRGCAGCCSSLNPASIRPGAHLTCSACWIASSAASPSTRPASCFASPRDPRAGPRAHDPDPRARARSAPARPPPGHAAAGAAGRRHDQRRPADRRGRRHRALQDRGPAGALRRRRPARCLLRRQQRHRLNRTGNRQLNAALHMIALTQIRVHPPARDYIARRRAEGKTGKEAIRALKRHLIRTLYRLLKTCADRATIQVDAAAIAPCIT